MKSFTVIRYGIPEASTVQFDISNMSGSKVYSIKSDKMEAGDHSITWNGISNSGKNVSNGLYIYRITTNKGSLVHSCFIMR